MNKKTTYHLSFRFFLILPALLFFLKCSDSESLPDFTSSNTGPYILNVEHLELIRDNLEEPVLQQEYQILISGADDLLQDDSFEFVTQKNELPPSGDPHDYMSIARYSGSSDGVTNPMIYDYDRPRLARVSAAIYTLSLAYFLSGNDGNKNEYYAEKASELVYGWFLDESTRMNPNMVYAQVDFDTESEEGEHQRIIDANDFILVIEAVSLLYGSSHWPPNYHINLKQWFYEFSDWIIKNYNADAFCSSESWCNNISTWLDVQKAIYFLFTEQEERLNSNFHFLPISDKIKLQVQSDGRQPFEMTRSRQRHYEYFNLRAYMNLSLIRKNRSGADRDWPTPLNNSNYGGLKPALDLVMNDIKNEGDRRQLLDDQQFDDCRYLEIFMPAAIAFESSEYAETAELLINNGCSHPDITLTFPPLDWLHNQPDY